ERPSLPLRLLDEQVIHDGTLSVIRNASRDGDLSGLDAIQPIQMREPESCPAIKPVVIQANQVGLQVKSRKNALDREWLRRLNDGFQVGRSHLNKALIGVLVALIPNHPHTLFGTDTTNQFAHQS